ncbi:MAG: DUF4253 domain-containing protein [Pseudomonadota bacterium]
MNIKTDRIAGGDAIAALESRREVYPTTGSYPFLIGEARELERLQEAAEYNEQSFEDIVRGSLSVDLAKWISGRRREAGSYGFSPLDIAGTWPGEDIEKGAISLHRKTVSGAVMPKVTLGSASIAEPWQLPAVVGYGGWNDCPMPEVHCAFHRHWQTEFGAEIAGMSGDVIECVVSNPPSDQAAAMELAWQQYWYCTDIVEQGCETISNLAATLINSPYWFFWWD